jgi:hypothetical protein
MAHLIESSDTVAVYQSTAWHGLAKALEQYPSPTEARQIVAPWEIIPSTDLTVTLPNGNMVATDEFKAIVRSDNGAILGLHSRKYSPVSVGDFFDLCYEFGAVDTVKVDSAAAGRPSSVPSRGTPWRSATVATCPRATCCWRRRSTARWRCAETARSSARSATTP